MRIGKIIRNYRTKYGMSMSYFSRMSGISKPYVSMLEANTKINPSVKTLQKISNAVDIPLDDLFRMLDDDQSNINTILDSEERNLIDAYRGLNVEGRTILQGVIRSLINTYPAGEHL